MCGLAITINGTLEQTKRMAEAISHRGIEQPTYTKIDNIIVGFVRLPITDKKAPHPPFVCNGHYVWLNGYISNYKELTDKYEISLVTECDTEFLSKFLFKFGHDKMNELNGFFSIAHYNGELHLFTDRYGIKQLYKYSEGNTHFICSEIKGFPKELGDVEDWKYSLGIMSDTIYKDVKKIPNLPFPKPEKIKVEYEEAKLELTKRWVKSIERNKYPNAGVMLSGGVDSGMIAKWFKPAYSFSMDYQCDKSEIENIKLNSIGKHYTIIHNEDTFEDWAYKTLNTLDDLKAGSCYTNFALADLASRFCRVVYSGAGADEIFNGYTHRYNKPINDVIRRTNAKGKHYDITHKEYDWLYLKGILIVEDRVGGAHALETRYPFLDNDFVDYALSLPDEFLNNKRILKDISLLPKEITEGKKRGFSNPITNEEWINFLL